MKYIRYKIRRERNEGTDELPNIVEYFVNILLTFNEANEEIAKREAYNGEYTIEDDGEPEPTQEPTQLDRVEAQAVYTAMMTDTLLESEV